MCDMGDRQLAVVWYVYEAQSARLVEEYDKKETVQLRIEGRRGRVRRARRFQFIGRVDGGKVIF